MLVPTQGLLQCEGVRKGLYVLYSMAAVAFFATCTVIIKW